MINQKKMKKVSLCLLSVAMIFLNLGTEAYAQSTLESVPYEVRHGIELYRHHKDESPYCVLVNDIVLTDEEVQALFQLPDKEDVILKRVNFQLRKGSNLKTINTDSTNVQVNISQLSGDEVVYEIGFESVQDSKILQINSKIYVIEEMATEFEPDPTPAIREKLTPTPKPIPTITTKPTPTSIVTPTVAPVATPILSAPEETIIYIEENEVPALEMQPRRQPTMQPEVQREAIPTKSLLKPSAVEDLEETLLEGEDEYEPEIEESDEVEKEIKEVKKDRSILEYSYVATFSLSGVFLALFGISIFLDIKAIIWYKRKRKENRDKRCRH